MRPTRIALAAALILLATTPLLAEPKRRAVAPPSGHVSADALGIGHLSGAALAGTVESVEGTVVTLDTGGAPAIRIEAKDAKVIAGDAMPRTAADITAGARITAYVESGPEPGAPLVARLIAVESRPELMIAGVVESVDLPGSSFTVLGISIAVDDDTLFETAFPTFAPMRGLEDLRAGNVVKVDAALTGALVLAERVLVVSPLTDVPERPASIRGVVKSISESSWVITEQGGGDVTVEIDSSTKIAGDPQVGDEVQAIVQRDAAGNLVALMIVKLGPGHSGSFHFKGWVQSIGPEQWTIGGPPGSLAPSLAVKITPATEIYPDPKVGDIVRVEGTRDDAGNYVATSITKEDWH